MTKHLNILVSGQVQGVNFRNDAQRVARGLGLYGWAENRGEASVYLEVEGPEEFLEKFLEWCRQGNGLSKVSQVEVVPGELKNYQDFIIKRSLSDF